MFPGKPPQSCSMHHISSFNAMKGQRWNVHCTEVSGLLWDGCRKQSNWIIILIVKYKVGIKIRVHSTIFKVLNQAVASLKLRQLRTVCDCFLCLNQLSKSLVNNYQQQWWCWADVSTRLSVTSYGGNLYIWRLSILTSSKMWGRQNSM